MPESPPPPQRGDALWILVPTYNDWDALALFLGVLDDALSSARLDANVVIVDDGSTMPRVVTRFSDWQRLREVEVLSLRRNLGHQRAIAVGLCHLIDTRAGRGIVVIDGDGEDAPADIPRLLAASPAGESGEAVFGARLRRSEGIAFAAFYHLYRLLHRVLTGVAVRMGNFSYVPWKYASRLVVCGELWNHYAAALVHSRIPYRLVPCARASRLTGQSKMSPVSLVTHGLSAMAVFADRIGVRALATSGAAVVVSLLAAAVVVAIKWGTALAIPGWATMAVGLLLVLATELVMLSTLFAFLVLSGRSQTSVVPLRDYRFYVETVTRL
jgi:hypothetical protein